MSTYALLTQTLLSTAISIAMQGEASKGKTEGDVVYKVQNQALGSILTHWCIIYSNLLNKAQPPGST